MRPRNALAKCEAERRSSEREGAPAPRDRTWSESLRLWQRRAPWLVLSFSLHFLCFLLIVLFFWDAVPRRRPTEFLARLGPPLDELFETPREHLGELDEVVEVEEPVLEEVFVVEEVEESFTSLNETPFDASRLNDLSGFGGFAGGKMGERFAPRTGAKGGGAAAKAVALGLEWLRAHQTPAGYWDCDGFSKQCGAPGFARCRGAGSSQHDVGVTGLALLAFLGDGSTTGYGPHQDTVRRGVHWLVDQAAATTGRIGRGSSDAFVYDHAIATLALCESYYFVKSPRVRRVAQGAVDFILRARNSKAGWRYAVPPDGRNDTSVTGWMVFALTAAKDAGLAVDNQAFEGAIAVFNDMTDSNTGRVGYTRRGGPSGRGNWNSQYATSAVETLTAVGLMSRIFVAGSLGHDNSADPILRKHADLILEALPKWDRDHVSCDMYYWYHGSLAMYQMGGEDWDRWRVALERAVVRNQELNGDAAGSWDPVGPWGRVGGRVYSTALMTLSLEAYYRYGRVFGLRQGNSQG